METESSLNTEQERTIINYEKTHLNFILLSGKSLKHMAWKYFKHFISEADNHSLFFRKKYGSFLEILSQIFRHRRDKSVTVLLLEII